MWGTKLRRFTTHSRIGKPLELAADHPAITSGRTLFPSTVVSPANAPRLLVSGHNSRKIGGKVVKGRWAGMPIFTLTLEERATCPVSCAHWRDCYGNHMHWTRRHKADRYLVPKLERELALLAAQYPAGFVVRLHVLGDFWSREYVSAWHDWMLRFQNLHVFGYTAWSPETKIGFAVRFGHALFRERWRIRFSNGPEAVLRTGDDGIVCPAQTSKTECCGTCGLCWSTEKPIRFLPH